jgi:hypothetical protein
LVSVSLTTLSNSALLDLTNINDVNVNVNDVNVCISSHPMVIPDSYHPSILQDSKLTLEYNHTSRTPHRNCVQDDSFLLYNSLLASCWLGVLNENSIDSAVHQLTSALTEAMSLAIPFVKCSNYFSSHCSSSVKYYIKKKAQFS